MPWRLTIRGPHDSVEIVVHLSFGKQLPTLLGQSWVQRLQGARLSGHLLSSQP